MKTARTFSSLVILMRVNNKQCSAIFLIHFSFVNIYCVKRPGTTYTIWISRNNCKTGTIRKWQEWPFQPTLLGDAERIFSVNFWCAKCIYASRRFLGTYLSGNGRSWRKDDSKIEKQITKKNLDASVPDHWVHIRNGADSDYYIS